MSDDHCKDCQTPSACGHYAECLRTTIQRPAGDAAPLPADEVLAKVERALARVTDFACDVHHGEWSGPPDRRDQVVTEADAALDALAALLSLRRRPALTSQPATGGQR